MTLADFWAQTLRRLHNELSEQQFQLAIAPITVGEESGAWVIYAKNQFSANLLRSQYASKLAAIRSELAPNAPELTYKVGIGIRYEMAEEVSKNKSAHQHTNHHDISSDTESDEDVPTHTPIITIDYHHSSDTDTPPPATHSGSPNTKKNKKNKEEPQIISENKPQESPSTHQPLVFTLTEPNIPEPESKPEPEPKPERKTKNRKNTTTAQDILAERMNHLGKPSTSPNTNQTTTNPSAIETAKKQTVIEHRLTQTNLSPEYTFSTLVEGKGNQLAMAIAKSIAEKPGESVSNPFFVYGSTGLGKTHLVQAIGNQLLFLNPKARVRYMHSDEYLKTFMAAVRNRTWDSFKQQYLHYNLLIIDDIQFIQGKDRTMEEFFFLFEHFHHKNQQIVLTCDQMPSSLENMEQRLISRFSWGMTIKLEPPELEMRIDILERKAEAAGVMLYEDAAFFIAQNVKQNVRELEGALNRVLARCRFEQRNVIDVDLATDALQDIIVSNYKPVTIELIMKGVADFYHIRISDLLGKKRTRNVARPRQMAMALAKELTNMSLPAIGDNFGGRDHTTVMHAIKTITKLRREDPELNSDYEKLIVLVQN